MPQIGLDQEDIILGIIRQEQAQRKRIGMAVLEDNQFAYSLSIRYAGSYSLYARADISCHFEKYSDATRAHLAPEKPVERIQANLDERLRSIIPHYLEGRRRDILAISTALDNGDYERIRMLGHKMRGSGAGYGFPEITAIGQRLELAAESRDAKKTREHITELSEYLEMLELMVQKSQ